MIAIHRHLHRCHVANFEVCNGPGTDDRQGNHCNHQPRQKTCLHECFQVCCQLCHLVDSCAIAGSHNREPNTHYARERKVPQKFDKACKKRVRIAMINCNSCVLPQPISYGKLCAVLRSFRSQAKAGVRAWINFSNHRRPHTDHGGRPPAMIYWQQNQTHQPGQQEQRVA